MNKPENRSGQIPLVLPVEESRSREDLLESSANRLAIDLVDRWPDWPSNVVVLAGPVGSGKSHIGSIWAKMANAGILAMKDLPTVADAGAAASLLLEDATSETVDEAALFHAFNRARETGNFIVITSRGFPASWGLQLADLASRLKLAHLVELHEPDDELLSGLIVKLFADRQLQVPPPVVSYLVTRMERSMAVAGQIVDWLDREALARRKKITRTLAAEALEAVQLASPEN